MPIRMSSKDGKRVFRAAQDRHVALLLPIFFVPGALLCAYVLYGNLAGLIGGPGWEGVGAYGIVFGLIPPIFWALCVLFMAAMAMWPFRYSFTLTVDSEMLHISEGPGLINRKMKETALDARKIKGIKAKLVERSMRTSSYRQRFKLPRVFALTEAGEVLVMRAHTMSEANQIAGLIRESLGMPEGNPAAPAS
jgi:hypothetical protein